MSSLQLADAASRADLATYVSRARTLDPDGAMRLQAAGRALACYVGVLPGSGLMGQGSVIGLRVLPLAEPATVDTTVPLAALSDRLARRMSVVGTEERLDLPPATVHVGWAAVAPPRAGWEPAGRLPAALLQEAARAGIAEVAQGSGPAAGGHAVSALREAVWSRPLEGVEVDAPGLVLRAGAAFAAHVLGFLAASSAAGSEVDVLRNGRWLRVSTPTGHVLVR